MVKTMSERMLESHLYDPIRKWLELRLRSRHKRSKVHVIDTSRKALSSVIEEQKWVKLYPGWETFDVHVDIAGFVISQKTASIYLIEVKLTAVTLRDLGQMLGYCRVVNPGIGLILSPGGLSDAMNLLLRVHKKYQILDYAGSRRIGIARWQSDRSDVEYASVVPPGWFS